MFDLNFRPARRTHFRSSRSDRGAARRLALSLESLESRRVLAAEVGLADPAPLFTIGEGVCSSVDAGGASLEASSVDAAFAGDSLTAEAEPTPPEISGFGAQDQGGGNWVVSGTVSDDGPVAGLPVYISFGGNFQGVVYTDAAGAFSYSLSIGNDFGFVDAEVYDGDGMNGSASYYIESTAEPPEVHNFGGYHDQGGMWLFSGTVSDDESVEGLSVSVTFNGNYEGTAITAADGSFSVAVFVGSDWGFVEAVAYDIDNMASEPASYLV